MLQMRDVLKGGSIGLVAGSIALLTLGAGQKGGSATTPAAKPAIEKGKTQVTKQYLTSAATSPARLLFQKEQIRLGANVAPRAVHLALQYREKATGGHDVQAYLLHGQQSFPTPVAKGERVVLFVAVATCAGGECQPCDCNPVPEPEPGPGPMPRPYFTTSIGH